jgi:hypothetical protein
MIGSTMAKGRDKGKKEVKKQKAPKEKPLI